MAGMAALVQQRFSEYSAQQVATYLKNNADGRRDVPNITWGYGFAQLPPVGLPPVGLDGCEQMVTDDGAVDGQWASGCQSEVSGRGYARYYSFTLAQQSQVTIDLESSEDTYLYLRTGDAISGTAFHEDDDVVPGSDTDSRIVAMLAAGTYTIEATTYNAGEAGSVTLTISGLGGGTTEPGTRTDQTDSCGATISSDGATPGTWASGCQSQVTRRGYARYYSFTLAQQSQATIDLESSVDPYLYLRSGDSRSGTVLHENDDVVPGSDTDSRIVATLAAGSYTIEATTYNAGEAGSFTLTISGLGDGTTEPGTGTDQTDSCGATISSDSATPGTWASGCQSQVTGRGYARYYSFTLAQQSQATIDLESSVDPYLYLRSGDSRSGTVLHENDDVVPGLDTDSRIVATLAAGSYTIEATTYNAGEAGSFTLTISGLGGGSM